MASVCSRRGIAALVLAALAALSTRAAAGGGAAEAIEVPRDVGTLPRVNFTRVLTGPGDYHYLGDTVLDLQRDWRRAQAFDLAGRSRWRVSSPGGEQIEYARAAAGVVALASKHYVAGFDARSGKRRWQTRIDGALDTLTANGAGFVARFQVMSPGTLNVASEAVALFDAATGRERWRTTCPDSYCWLVDTNADDILVDAHEKVVRLDPRTGENRGAIALPGKRLAVGGDVLLAVQEERAPGDGIPSEEDLTLHAVALSDGRHLWQTKLGRGSAGDVRALRSGGRFVVVAPHEAAILDATTGAASHRAALPEHVSFSQELTPLPDGRAVLSISVRSLRQDLPLLMVIDPNVAAPIAFLALPNDVASASVEVGGVLSTSRGDWGTVAWSAPLPPSRASLPLADDVKGRLARLLAAAERAGNSAADPETFDRERSLPLLHRLALADREDAVIALVDRGATVVLPALAGLLGGRGEEPDARGRAALERALASAVDELPAAKVGRRLPLMRASLALLDALPVPLPERPARALGDALAATLRETLGRASAEGPATLDAARAFLPLLARAPYADLDGPLRATVAARVAAQAPGKPSALCSPAARPLTADEAMVADLAWAELGLDTAHGPTLIALPEAPSALPPTCLELPTLGGPVIVGSKATLDAIRKGFTGRLSTHLISARPLSKEGRAFLEDGYRGVFKAGDLKEASFSEGSGSRTFIIVRVAGRWHRLFMYRRVIV